MTENAASAGTSFGGAFLFESPQPAPLFTAEDISEDQRAYFTAMRQFTEREVVPNIERLEKKDLSLLRKLLRQAGELGLLLAEIPEAYGGLELDVTTAMRMSEAMSLFGSWSVTVGCHTGIGSLPIVYFGTESQKRKYLPRLATAEWVAAYALTEPTSGSDALGARTTARLSSDGKFYLLNGAKQFITNAGIADVFVVFAKIDGDKFTGFVVERSARGLTVGPEEHKMGIRGSSTCPLFFEDCQVPVENVLGEIGKGHRIAFNILNLGRLKLGVGSVGGSRNILGDALSYVRERRQFGKALIEFPLIREKLARSAAAIHALESMAYRTTGMIDERIGARPDVDRSVRVIKAVEEYSIEASILKVMGSETLGAVVDEALQMHGGYGYIEGSHVERAYRDVRINRLYEGTNEINRMLISGTLLKRASKGQLPLAEAIGALQQPLPTFEGPLGPQRAVAAQLKRLSVMVLKLGIERFGPELESRQEILAAAADVIGEAFAVDSAVARTLKVGPGDEVRRALLDLYAFEALPRAVVKARTAICCSAEGEALTTGLAQLEELAKSAPIDPAAKREVVVEAMLRSGGYPFGN
jgi:alkylation response protein AidB-like acyl-CoA dehydrogenase